MFDVHQKITNRHGEIDEDRTQEYLNGLMEAFAASPEAGPLLAQEADLGWAAMMMEYAISYEGDTPPEMSPGVFQQVVFGLFPRKVSADAESAPGIIAVLKAFWSFLQRQYALPNAAPILAGLNDEAIERLRKELANPQNYGMAKSFFMLGQQAGFDMTTQEGINAFMAVYNSRILGARAAMGPEVAPPLGPLGGFFGPPSSGPRSTEAQRKEKKRQRQAKKRNRRK